MVYNDVIRNIQKPVEVTDFADNSTIYCKEENYESTIVVFQKVLNQIWDRSFEPRYNFSQCKTEYIIFFQKKIRPLPTTRCNIKKLDNSG